MKKRNLLFGISAACLLGVSTIGLVSCGEPKVDDTTDIAPILKEVSGSEVSLSGGLLVESETSKYFTPTIVEKDGDDWKYVSSGGKALVTPSYNVFLKAYGVPEGYVLSAEVFDEAGNVTTKLKVNSDGSLSIPSVTSLEKYKVMLYARSTEKSIVYKGDSYYDIIRKSVEVDVCPDSALAGGDVYTFNLDAEGKTEAAAALEKYGLEHGLTGLTLSNNGGYQLYNDRISSPLLDADNYLAGYGFGTPLYGKITKPLDAEQTEDFKYFYHNQITPNNEPGLINYLNSSEASVGDLYGYMSSSYFYNPLNEDYTSYEYRGSLARVDEPEPLDMDEDGLATTWKIKVRVGADVDDNNGGTVGATYRTASTKFSKYDHRKIQLEDYLTTFKLLATKSIGWFRGTEQAGEETASRQIKGYAEFYNNSGSLTKLPSDEEFSKQVGVSIDHSDNSITIQFNAGFTQEYAIYNIDSMWSNPMCEDFIKELGGGDVIKGAQLYGTSPSGMSPLDTALCVGPYYTYYYESKKTVAFKKNEDWFLKEDNYGRKIYQIEGYHLNVNSAIDSDENAYIDAFEAGKIDASNIPDASWDKYLTDPRRKAVQGSNTIKITANTCDKPLYDYYFGEGGVWHDRYNSDNAVTWEVKPVASNRNFFYGLNLAIDRVAYAEKYHQVPSFDYANPVNKINPVTPELYNSSKMHKEAIKSVYGSATDDLSKTMQYSVAYLEAGLQEELEAGHYKLGTGSSPEVVELELGTIEGFREDRVALISQNWSEMVKTAVLAHVDEDGGNSWVDADGNPRITFKLKITGASSDNSLKELVTKGLWCGKWDLQFAYLIEGNAYDTLNGLNILMSNKMGGFELNFGVDTSIPDASIYFDGKYWSFEGLWQATQGGVVLDAEGKAASGEDLYTPDDDSLTYKKLEDGSYEFTFNMFKAEGFDIEMDTSGFYYVDSAYEEYLDGTDIKVNDDGSVTMVIPADGIIDGATVGVGDDKVYFEFKYYFEVTGASGKTAEYNVDWGFVLPKE